MKNFIKGVFAMGIVFVGCVCIAGGFMLDNNLFAAILLFGACLVTVPAFEFWYEYLKGE